MELTGGKFNSSCELAWMERKNSFKTLRGGVEEKYGTEIYTVSFNTDTKTLRWFISA